MRAPTAIPALLAALAALAAGACSDSGGPAAPTPPSPTAPSPTPSPAPSPVTIGLSAAPAAVTVEQGQSGTATIALARGGDVGAVTLGATVAGGPAGVTAALAPATVPAAASGSVVTLATTAATPAGEHTVTITGTGAGATATTTLVLRVTAAPAAAGYGMTVSPSPVATTAGGAAAGVTVAIARTNFAGGVALAASGAPAGLTVAVPNTPVTDASAAVGVRAAASVAAGDYPITLTGTAAGLAPVTAGFVVRVAQPQAEPAPAEGGVVTGVALDAAGRPLAGATVHVKMLFNPNVATTRTGADGRYAVRGLPVGLSHQIWAYHQAEYAGRSYCVRLAMPNLGDYDAFVPSAPVTRDFRWQLTGRIPDAGNNHFGASVVLALTSSHFYEPVLEDGDEVEVKLTPQGPLVDGSAGSVVTRTARYAASGWASRLDDIPHGVYTAAATRVRGGVRTPLRVGRLGSGQVAPTTTVAWEPNRPGSCGHVLGPDLGAFSLQLENP